ncbi:MAG: glycosyl hydrolase [Pseudomonadota bacterium]
MVFSFHDFLTDTNNSQTPDKTFLDPMEGDGGTAAPMPTAKWLADRGSFLSLAWAIYCCDYNTTRFWLRLKKPHNHINDVLNGVHDGFIRQSARQIKEAGTPIMLAVMGEFNWQGQFLFGSDGRTWIDGTDNICNKYGDPSWPDGPERIRDMHRHIIDIFRDEGVTNVTWLMYAGNQYMQPGVEGQSRWLHPQYYYPGDEYIDWIGQSVYFTRSDWVNKFEDVGTFNQVFVPGYNAWREVTNKPMMLPEFGILAEQGADRTAVWNELFTNSLKQVPGVKAVTIADSLVWELYFDIPQLSTNGREVGAVAPFIKNDPYFSRNLRIGSP